MVCSVYHKRLIGPNYILSCKYNFDFREWRFNNMSILNKETITYLFFGSLIGNIPWLYHHVHEKIQPTNTHSKNLLKNKYTYINEDRR